MSVRTNVRKTTGREQVAAPPILLIWQPLTGRRQSGQRSVTGWAAAPGSRSSRTPMDAVPYVAPVVQDEPMSDPQLLELLDSGTRRLIRSVDAMTDDQWLQPSLLPGWTRAHVVAHLTLNAEGLSAALEGVHEGRPVPMYRVGRGARLRHRRAGLRVAVRAARQVPGLDDGDRRVGGGACGQPGRHHDRADARRAVVPGPRRRRHARPRGRDPPRRPGARLHRGRLDARVRRTAPGLPLRRGATTASRSSHTPPTSTARGSSGPAGPPCRASGALWHGGRRAGAPATD